jgi:hypothetical protein
MPAIPTHAFRMCQRLLHLPCLSGSPYVQQPTLFINTWRSRIHLPSYSYHPHGACPCTPSLLRTTCLAYVMPPAYTTLPATPSLLHTPSFLHTTCLAYAMPTAYSRPYVGNTSIVYHAAGVPHMSYAESVRIIHCSRHMHHACGGICEPHSIHILLLSATTSVSYVTYVTLLAYTMLSAYVMRAILHDIPPPLTPPSSTPPSSTPPSSTPPSHLLMAILFS